MLTGLNHFPRRLRDQRGLADRRLARRRSARLGQTLLLAGELARAEPKTLRYRLLHVAARLTQLTRGVRQLRLRIQASWP